MRKRLHLLFRILAVLLAALLLASCGLPVKPATTEAEETEDPNVGKYYLGAADARGYGFELDEDDVENNYLRLKDDGTLLLQLQPNDIRIEGKWKVKKDVLTLELYNEEGAVEDECEGSIEDGIIDITIDAYHLIFVKGKSAAKKYMEAHPATDAETTEAPTEVSTTAATTEPETTAAPTTAAPAEPSTHEFAPGISISNYYVIFWNDWHSRREFLEVNYFSFPSNGSKATLYIGNEVHQAEWSVSGDTLHLKFDAGRSIDAQIGDNCFTFNENDLKAYFVYGLDRALEEWDKRFSESGTTEAPTGPGSEGSTPFTINEQLICDRDGIKVTAVKVVENERYGVGIELKVENNTDMDIYVAATTIAVNGAMVDNDFFCRAEPGKTETDVMFLDKDVLAAYSIEKVGYIDFCLHAVNRATYDSIFEETKPARIKTSEYGREDKPQAPEDSGRIFDESGVQIYFVHTAFDNYGDLYSRLYFVNNTGKRIIVDYGDMFINGTEVDAFLYETIEAGCVLLCDMEYDDDSVKALGMQSIDDLKSAGFNFEFLEDDSYDSIAVTGLLELAYEE